MEWLSPIVSCAAIAWRRFVQAVDWVLLCYLRVANPKYVVATFVLLNVLIGLSTLVLAKSWDEFYTISGYWVTLTGFLVAIGELYRARTVTDQIQKALGREIRIQRGRFYRFCLERAKATLWDVQACVLGFDWSLAVMRSAGPDREFVAYQLHQPGGRQSLDHVFDLGPQLGCPFQYRSQWALIEI